MAPSPLSIATLVGSRICHDLISPVGAINNGIELISMGGPLDSPELTLISDSVANASARIKFFRIAFGSTSGEQMIGAPEVAKIAKDAFDGGRYAVDWQAMGDVPRAEVQAAYLAILCLESALPRGGTVTVRRVGEKLHLNAVGTRIACDPALWAPLAKGEMPDDLGPAHVQFALLALAVPPLGREIETTSNEDQVDIKF